jgi:FixJ family two-component response regulator
MGAVFLVEKDPSVRQAIARLVEAEGLVVRQSERVDALLQRDSLASRACAVIDFSGARSWGPDVRTALAAMSVTVPIIAIDASDDFATRRIARRLGASAYFRKPIDGPALIDAIHWALWSEGTGPSRHVPCPPPLPGAPTSDSDDDEPPTTGPDRSTS